MAESVSKAELDAALSQMKETIMEDVRRELEQRVKAEDVQTVLTSEMEALKAKMIELETKLSTSADQVRELQAKLQKETPVQTFTMETPKKSGDKGDVDMKEEDEVVKYSRADLEKLKGVDLKRLCRARKVRTSGSKAALVDRLLEAQGAAEDEPNEDDKYSAEGLKFLTVVQLKDMCRDGGISTTGNKAEIIDKLVSTQTRGN